ncbi:MAG: RHS repeat protein [Syntrophobacteraceae bacterium]
MLERLTATSEPLGASSYTYDAAGRITGFTDPHGFSISYIYDAAGNLTQITYPDSTTVTYTYDAANRLTTVTDWASGQAAFTYDQAGRLSTFTQFNGIVTAYAYDIASRLTDMSSPVASYQFALDGNGNRTNSVENEPLPPALSLGSTIYDYNARRNRLLSAGDANYTYDNEGQLATAGGTVLTFNCDHRLAEINDGGTIHQFSYDARGNRLKTIRDGIETRYIYDPFGNLLAEADSLNQITRKYIYGKGLLALATPTGRYCYHFNPARSTIAITDMTQAVVNSYAYEPFGQILAQQETFPQPFKFVGKYGVMAEPNGLYYMRARYYDPGVGRFISEDPIGFAGGDVNLFAYVQNNPVKWVDPEGLQAVPAPSPGIPLPLPPVVIPGTPENKAFVKSFMQILRSLRDSVHDPCGEGEDIREFCRKEKEKCIELCVEIMVDPDARHVYGGSMSQCIQNCLPEICGGEAKWKGYK